MEKFFFRASASDFKKIPGSPVAYWVSEKFRNLFVTSQPLEKVSKPKQGATTSDNTRFLRIWSEVAFNNIGFGCKTLDAAKLTGLKWFPYNKGGDFRRWYGNQEFLINYKDDGLEIKAFHDELNKTSPGGRLKNQDCYFKESVSWSKISSGSFAARYFPSGFIFDVAGSSIIFDTTHHTKHFLGLLNSGFVRLGLKALSPTLNYEAEHLCKLPINTDLIDDPILVQTSESLVSSSKLDWDSYETSWDFGTLPLLAAEHRGETLQATYQSLRAHWQEQTLEMQRLEEENNRLFISAYGLDDELTPEVPLSEITLTCNPHYRYGGDKTEAELEALLVADTMRELVSYGVGCMFGRYSLDEAGLILANQGEGVEQYHARIPNPQFAPDTDNVLPILDGLWFTDDIVERFRQFLKVAFGSERYEENLRFIEQALNVKNKRHYSLRDYLVSEFYADHVKRYKKRPIYWLFSSPKGHFNALVYLHRYRSDTVSVVLNSYLKEFQTKLQAQRENLQATVNSATASDSEKLKARKEMDKLKAMLDDLEKYERDTLFPLAAKQLELDLDDGVKVNYLKLGAALKKIPGLESKDD